MRAKFKVDSVLIRDIGLDTMSVTNDAEAVVEHLLERFGPDVRFYYYDSMGELDELCHDGVKFTRFNFGGPSDGRKPTRRHIPPHLIP